MATTFESFMHRYGPADGRYTVVEVGETIDHRQLKRGAACRAVPRFPTPRAEPS